MAHGLNARLFHGGTVYLRLNSLAKENFGMNPEEKVWCVIFSPENKGDKIQGIRLRETAEKIALQSNPPIFGKIKNRPDGLVEMVCKVDKNNLNPFLNRIKKIAFENTGISIAFAVHPAGQLENWESFDEFIVEKKGQMEEMDLSIRGAELLFGKMYQDMVAFRKQDQFQRLEGLEDDLSSVVNWIENGGRKGILHQLESEALHDYLIHPFDEKLTRVCREINQIYLDHKIERNSSPFSEEDLDKLAKLIKNGLTIISVLKDANGTIRINKSKKEGE